MNFNEALAAFEQLGPAGVWGCGWGLRGWEPEPSGEAPPGEQGAGPEEGPGGGLSLGDGETQQEGAFALFWQQPPRLQDTHKGSPQGPFAGVTKRDLPVTAPTTKGCPSPSHPGAVSRAGRRPRAVVNEAARGQAQRRTAVSAPARPG